MAQRKFGWGEAHVNRTIEDKPIVLMINLSRNWHTSESVLSINGPKLRDVYVNRYVTQTKAP